MEGNSLENDLQLSEIFDALAQDVNDPKSLNKLVQVILALKIPAENVPSLIMNKAKNSTLDDLLNNAGSAFWESQHYDYVIPLLQQSLEVNPANPDTLFNMGYILHDFGESERALKYLESIAIKSTNVLTLIKEINLWLRPAFFDDYKVEFFQIPGMEKPVCARINTSDPHVLKEIFQQRNYEFTNLSFTPKLIIDGGANAGYSSVFFANIYPQAHIIAVEPEQSNFEILQYNTRPYKKVKLIESGIWHKNTYLNVRDIGLGKWGTIVEETSDTEPGAFRAVTISSLLENSDYEEIDILKLDIEGAEKEVFTHGYDEWLDKVKILIIELHDNMKRGCSNAFFKAVSNYKFACFVKGENIVLIKEDYLKVYEKPSDPK
ncbi:MAG: FkbM family methyltransferase [Bacilli bacterium]|nr:FkbM family methyltransferase [Bacilli bacterium]